MIRRIMLFFALALTMSGANAAVNESPVYSQRFTLAGANTQWTLIASDCATCQQFVQNGSNAYLNYSLARTNVTGKLTGNITVDHGTFTCDYLLNSTTPIGFQIKFFSDFILPNGSYPTTAEPTNPGACPATASINVTKAADVITLTAV